MAFACPEVVGHQVKRVTWIPGMLGCHPSSRWLRRWLDIAFSGQV